MTDTSTQRRTPASGTFGVVMALLAAIVAFQLNASMLSPVLATMEKELDTTAAQIGVTQTAFFTAAALFSLIMPRWGDLIGRKRIMLGLLAVTGVGSVLAAVATSVDVLLVARVIQGASGPIVPMALIMLRAAISDDKRYAFWMAVLASVNGGIAGVDALAGGWLASTFGFHAVFWTMAVVCVVALVCVVAGVGDSRNVEDRHPMDWKGAAPLVISLGAVLIAFNELGKLSAANWTLFAVLMVVGILAFVIFWRVESTTAAPLVSTHYLKERRTWGLLLTTVLTMTGVFAVMNGLVPNLAQAKGFGGIDADSVSWITLTPYALAGLLMGPIAGKLASRFGYLAVLRAGIVITIVGVGVAVLAVSNPASWLLFIVSTWIGISYAGMTNIMLNGLGVVLSPKDNTGYLPGMNSGAFNIGAGLSFALLFAVNTWLSDGSGAAAGYRGGMLTGALVLVLALLASFLIPEPTNAEHFDDEGSASAAGQEVTS